MKPIKMFGLAALAALMAMAFVGASSAMANGPTALCTVEQNPCSGGNIITHVHETSVGKAVILGSPKIECNVLFLGDALDSGLSEPLIIHGTLTYTSCSNFCSVKEVNGPGAAFILKTAAELAAAQYEWLISITCPFIKCSFTSEGLESHGLGPLTSSQANGSFVISNQELQLESFSGPCPEEPFLDITTTPLIKTYISS